MPDRLPIHEPPIQPLALILCAAAAPPLSALFGLFGSLAVNPDDALHILTHTETFDGLAYLALGFGLVAVIGVWPALVFGGIAAWLAERRLKTRPVAPWALAGALAAVAYVVVSLLAGLALPSIPAFFSPWVLPVLDDADPAFGSVVILSIVASGAVVGLIYRRLSRSVAREGARRSAVRRKEYGG